MALANPNVFVYAVDTGWLDWLVEPNSLALLHLQQKYPSLHLDLRSAGIIRQAQLDSAKNLAWERGWSRSFVPDPRPHLCFIDADHETSAVLADFFHCWEIAASGALIAGHDYSESTVRAAVEKISLVLESKPNFGTPEIWFWRKP